MSFSEKQLKDALKSIRMSHDERTSLRSALYRHMNTYAQPVKSPFVRNAHRFILQPMQAIAIMLVVLVSSGTGLSYAANEALPGDPLYGFKISVTEEIKTITMGADARAEYEVERAAKRLEETAQLALTGRLDHAAEAIITEQLIKHTEKAKEYAQKARTEKPETPVTVAADISSELSAHTQVLTEIKEIKQINGELSAILETTEEKLVEAEKDEEEALATLAETESKITAEYVAEKRKEAAEKLAKLEDFVTSPVENIEADLETISADLETISIETKEEAKSVETIAEIETALEKIELETKEEVESAELTEETTPALDDPTLIESVQADIVIIKELLAKADTAIESEEYASAFSSIKEALKYMNNQLSLIELKEKYSNALEDELISTDEKTKVDQDKVTETTKKEALDN